MAPPGGQAGLKPHASGARSIPAVVFDHVVEFNDVLPLFVFLAALKGLLLKGEKGLPVTDETFTTRQWGLEMDRAGLILYMKKLWPREAQLPAQTQLAGLLLTGNRENFETWVFLKSNDGSNRFYSPGIANWWP